MESSSQARVGKPRGRPPKFASPSRVVTLTLPEETLAALASIDSDRARAIVEATRIACSQGSDRPSKAGDGDSVRVERMAHDTALITVPFSQSLAAIPGLSLVEFQPGRNLVMVAPDRHLPEVEIAVLDALDRLDEQGEGAERAVLSRLLERLQAFRRSDRVRTALVILVDASDEAQMLSSGP